MKYIVQGIQILSGEGQIVPPDKKGPAIPIAIITSAAQVRGGVLLNTIIERQSVDDAGMAVHVRFLEGKTLEDLQEPSTKS